MWFLVSGFLSSVSLAADLKDVLTPLVRHIGGETVAPFVGLSASSKEMRKHLEIAFLQANPVVGEMCSIEKCEGQAAFLKWKFDTSYCLPSQPLVCFSFIARLHKLWCKLTYECSLKKGAESTIDALEEKHETECLDLESNPYLILRSAVDVGVADKARDSRLKQALRHARQIFQKRWDDGKRLGIQDLDFFALFLANGLGGPVDHPTSVKVFNRLDSLTQQSLPHPSLLTLHLDWKGLLPGYLENLSMNHFTDKHIERFVRLLRDAPFQSQDLYRKVLTKCQEWNHAPLVLFVIETWLHVSKKTEDLRFMIGVLQAQSETSLSLDLLKIIVERHEVKAGDIRSLLFCDLHGLRIPESPQLFLKLLRHPSCSELDASLVLRQMRTTHPSIAWVAFRLLLAGPTVPNPWVLRESLLLLENFNVPEIHVFVADLFVRNSPLTMDQFFGAEVFLKLGFRKKAIAIFESSGLENLPADDWEYAFELGSKIGDLELCLKTIRIFAEQSDTTPEDWHHLELLAESYGFQCCGATKLELARKRLRHPATSREQLVTLAETFTALKKWKDAHSAWVLIQAKSTLSLEESIQMQHIAAQLKGASSH